jgi:hypothetical protein
MDLQNFGSESLYFDEALPPRVAALMQRAADAYGQGGAEAPLRAAEAQAPESLTVLVGLYRFLFYQGRHEEALPVALRVMAVIAPRIAFPADWRALDHDDLMRGVTRSMSLVRFYLSALKAAGYLNLRLCRFAEGKAMLDQVVALDAADRIGARVLLDVLAHNQADVIEFPVRARKEVRL